MELKKKIIIFGAGENGEKLLYRLGKLNVAFFCDNYKCGMEYNGKRVISLSELKEIYKTGEYDVLLSVNLDIVKKQLFDNKIYYWESFGITHNFFHQKELQEFLDRELLDKYMSLNYKIGVVKRDSNWFREVYASDLNKHLVNAMINHAQNDISNILSKSYDNENVVGMYDDEYYRNRPGMRLIANLIKQDTREKINVCDFACGHGDFLKMLKSDRISCYGVDVSVERCKSLIENGIECRLKSLEHCGYANEMFEYVTMMECLEHVEDPFVVMREAHRVLKENGMVFVTTPYGISCESDMHVRQFYEEDLYSVARECGYADIKIMQLPYLDSSYNDNLLMSARKI